MVNFLNAFMKEEDGQDMVEYSLLLAFIALAMITVLGTVKTDLKTMWTSVGTQINGINTQVNAKN